jgi:putative flippase GtrA
VRANAPERPICHNVARASGEIRPHLTSSTVKMRGRWNRRPPGPAFAAALVGEFPAFAVVGAAGFLVHAALLALLVRAFGTAPYAAWFPAFAASVLLTYLLHRRWTFRHRAGPAWRRELARYALLQALGALVNNGVFALALRAHPVFRAEPVLALAAGSGAAMVLNYLGARRLAFAHPGAAPRGPARRYPDRTAGAGALDARPAGTVITAAAQEPLAVGNGDHPHA